MNNKRNKITDDEILTQMVNLAGKGYSCSQIMISIELNRNNRQNQDLIRTMSGLGNGCGFFHETCGVMTSAAGILSLYAGKGVDFENESDKFLPMLQDLGDWFQNETRKDETGTRCKDIAGDLVGTDEGKQLCGSLIFKTYKKVDDILTAYDY